MKKLYFRKFANVVLSLMAIVATLFANMTCRGRCYEPIVPKELLKK